MMASRWTASIRYSLWSIFKNQASRNVADPVCHVNGRDVSCSDRPQK